MKKRSGPGLAKTSSVPLIRKRNVELWQSTDYRWRELFESADVMSEGATRGEPEGATYYGTTSILLAIQSRGGAVPDGLIDTVAQALRSDPHARLRAVRISCLEAQVRASGPIGRVRAELSVRKEKRGVRVDVEVEARVFAGQVTRKTKPRAVKRRASKK